MRVCASVGVCVCMRMGVCLSSGGLGVSEYGWLFVGVCATQWSNVGGCG